MTLSWRHATSTWEAVGVSKVVSCKHFYQKNLTLAQDRSSCRSFVEQFTMAEAPRSLDEDPDWVLNCIDNITTKVDLLRYCKKDDLKVRKDTKKCYAIPSRADLITISFSLQSWQPLPKPTRHGFRWRTYGYLQDTTSPTCGGISKRNGGKTFSLSRLLCLHFASFGTLAFNDLSHFLPHISNTRFFCHSKILIHLSQNSMVKQWVSILLPNWPNLPCNPFLSSLVSFP
ncbi:hypothetical protein MJO29_005401 [Puccinia striiformis f. sp. tritici]|nr:hypothetical protein MJO29_005401 [Puccinia striiformis f. sp. tritici]